jgi:CheY-like chemotaxis protein/class 3 adenylate cyclase
MPKILLVEDNLMNRDMLSRRLERRGFAVLTAGDGAEGVQLAKRERPDVILMDMSLPVMDGYEATRLLKADQEARAIPILGLSAHAMAGDADKARAAGCDDYDTKPVDFKRLLEKIDALLARGDGLAAAAAAAPPTTLEPLGGEVIVGTDQPLLRDAVVRRLESLGVRVRVVDDRGQLPRELAASPCDALLLAPSWLAVEEAKALETPPGQEPVPVFALLENESAEATLAALRRGARDVLPAPFAAELLRSRLGAALRSAADRSEQERLAAALADARGRAESLLRALLPSFAVEELARTRRVEPRLHTDVAVLFVDLLGFAARVASLGPAPALAQLQRWFLTCEEVAARHGVHKLKTSGDEFIGVVGLESDAGGPDRARAAVACALELVALAGATPDGLPARAGVHVGSLLTGVVGRSSFLFDAWGETIETAARLESVAASGSLYTSGEVWGRVQPARGALAGRLPRREGPPLDVWRIDALERAAR